MSNCLAFLQKKVTAYIYSLSLTGKSRLYEYTNIVYMRGLNACVSNSARISLCIVKLKRPSEATASKTCFFSGRRQINIFVKNGEWLTLTAVISLLKGMLPWSVLFVLGLSYLEEQPVFLIFDLRLHLFV